jgi:hypothetical protein
VIIGAVVVVTIALALLSRKLARRSAVEGGWYLRVIDAYSKGSALHDAMSAAERPGALAEESAARRLDLERRADDLAQTLYALRESAPDPDSRVRVADALESLQALRSAVSAERARGADAAQAETVRGRLFEFQASLRALRVPDESLPY